MHDLNHELDFQEKDEREYYDKQLEKSVSKIFDPYEAVKATLDTIFTPPKVG